MDSRLRRTVNVKTQIFIANHVIFLEMCQLLTDRPHSPSLERYYKRLAFVQERYGDSPLNKTCENSLSPESQLGVTSHTQSDFLSALYSQHLLVFVAQIAHFHALFVLAELNFNQYIFKCVVELISHCLSRFVTNRRCWVFLKSECNQPILFLIIVIRKG